jgi:hypothetical protein
VDTSAEEQSSDSGNLSSWRDRPPVDLRTDVAHSARIYDYLLGGKDNFPADRAAAEQAIALYPPVLTAAKEARRFLVRSTRFMAEAGIRQFLDIGTGIPTSPNLHEVAQEVAPDSRVVYVDNDPLVLAHARALLTSTPEGKTAYIDADLRQPERILNSPELLDTLDLSKPVGLSLLAIMHFITDEEDPAGIIATLVDALPKGSYVAVTHATGDFFPPELSAAGEDLYRSRGINFILRPKEQVLRLFGDLELVEPGLVVSHRWRPDGKSADVPDHEVFNYAGVGRKN